MNLTDFFSSFSFRFDLLDSLFYDSFLSLGGFSNPEEFGLKSSGFTNDTLFGYDSVSTNEPLCNPLLGKTKAAAYILANFASFYLVGEIANSPCTELLLLLSLFSFLSFFFFFPDLSLCGETLNSFGVPS